MKNLWTLACILAVVMSGAAAESALPQPPPAAAADCDSLAFGMVDCMGFLTVGGTETTPQGSCCSGLKTLVEVNADCICYALTTAANFGVDIDMSRARALPSRCGLAVPSFTTCHVSDSPNGSPANPPAESAPILPPPSAIGQPPAATFGMPTAPAPAPSNSSSVVPTIFFNFLFIIVFALLFINA